MTFDQTRLFLRFGAIVVVGLVATTVGFLIGPYATTNIEKWVLAAFEIIVGGTASTLILTRLLIRLRKEISVLISYHDLLHKRVGTARVTAVVLELVRPGFEKEMNRLAQLAGAEGLSLATTDLPRFTMRAFQLCDGPYIGTDQNVPSAFRKIYPGYLEDQIGRRRAEFSEDVRFLIVDPSALRDDHSADPYEFQMFYDLHWVHQVQLLQVDPARAEHARTMTQLPSASLGVYGWRYVLFYSPEAAGTVCVKARPITDPREGECRQYLEELVSYARVIRLPTGRAPVLERPTDEYREHLRRLVVPGRRGRGIA